jgi:DNA-binding CsgD family transcriptional regulator
MDPLLSAADLADVLSLVEDAHSARSAKQFRHVLVHGVGAMLESVSCVWTELATDLFAARPASTSVAELSIDTIDKEALLPLFNTYAWQHPVIAHVIDNGAEDATAISDLINRDAMQRLELYQLFWKAQHIEDQLSVGFVQGETVIGLSVNRNSWGFSDREREMLSRIAACTFSYYRALRGYDTPINQPVIQINRNGFEDHYQRLGITLRQAELLTLVAHGKSNKQIAVDCDLSEGTVRKHLENTFRRLNVNNRFSAVTAATTLLEEIDPGMA